MNSKLLRGSLDTIILKLLSENDKMYGYEITQKVKNITAGELKITEGALYPSLHRLEGKGVLSVTTAKVGNRVRKYYSLTEQGKTQTKEELVEFKQYLQNMKLVLNI